MKLKPIQPLAPPRPTIGKTGIAIPEWVPLEKTRELYGRYRSGVAAGGVIAVVLIVFGLLYLRHRHNVAEQSSRRFEEAYRVYSYVIPPADSQTVPMVATEEEKYQRARQGFQLVSDTYPGSEFAPVALYYAGNCLYQLKQFSQALEAYDQFLARYPGHRMAPQAHLGRANSLEQLSRYQEALVSYRTVGNGDSPLAFEGNIGAALCMLRLGETDRKMTGEAIATLNRLAAGEMQYAARTSRGLRRLLADLAPEK